MISRDAEPIAHRPVYKPVDMRHRRPLITREDIENGKVREPDPEAYWCDPAGNWHLKGWS